MAAGCSRAREYRIQYREMQRVRAKLARTGVSSRYANRHLFGSFFTVGYRRLNASNGEAAMLLSVSIHAAENRPAEHYEFMTFDRGIARVVELAHPRLHALQALNAEGKVSTTPQQIAKLCEISRDIAEGK